MPYPMNARSTSSHVDPSRTNTRPGHQPRPSPPPGVYCGSIIHDAELLLWHRLQERQLGGFRFHRQMRIPPYQVDFVCLSRQLVVEVADARCLDRARYRALEAAGYRCLRFRPGDIVGRIETVLAVIRNALSAQSRDT